VSLTFHTAARRIFPPIAIVLLLGLLVSQAASSVCNTQCMQHQLATRSAGDDSAMTDCHSMPQPEGLVENTCPGSAFCAIDLLANIQSKTLAPQIVSLDRHPDTFLPGLNNGGSAPLHPSVRSSFSDPPLITPLRV
jgi:hypothetical protein